MYDTGQRIWQTLRVHSVLCLHLISVCLGVAMPSHDSVFESHLCCRTHTHMRTHTHAQSQRAFASGLGRFFTCRGKHLANTCAPKRAGSQECKGLMPEVEPEPDLGEEAEAEAEAFGICFLCI